MAEHWVVHHASKAITVLITAAVTMTLISLFSPQWLTSNPHLPDIPAQTADNELAVSQLELDEARLRSEQRSSGQDSGLKIAAGIAAVAAGLLAWAKHEQTRADSKRADEEAERQKMEQDRLERQLEMSERRAAADERRSDRAQFNQRFSDAVEMLGHESPEIKQGGLYALEQISMDSAAHLQPVVEVICAFVRSSGSIRDHNSREEGRILNPVAQVAITILGRNVSRRAGAIGTSEAETVEPPRVDYDLRDAFLERADMSRGDFKFANFTRAHLGLAKLSECNLTQAIFRDADLHKATLSRAVARDADFAGANLHMADLTLLRASRANFKGAILDVTHCSPANFDGADLSHCNLRGADLGEAVLFSTLLDGADFTDATGLGIGQLAGARWKDDEPRWPSGFTPPLSAPCDEDPWD